MGTKRPADADLTPEEREAAARVTVYLVSCKHLDPSLGGDASDTTRIAVFRTEAEADDCVRTREVADRDPWNAYSVLGPFDLLSLWKREGLSLRIVRDLLRGKPSTSS
jgi:hypothetical protein